jgi:hypothetical protein
MQIKYPISLCRKQVRMKKGGLILCGKKQILFLLKNVSWAGQLSPPGACVGTETPDPHSGLTESYAGHLFAH